MCTSFIRRISTASLVVTCCNFQIACGSGPDSEEPIVSDNTGTTSSTTGGPAEPADACDAEHTILAPSDGLIANFADSASAVEQLRAYPMGDDTAPTYEVRDGALHMSVDTPTKADAQYLGVVVGLDGACVDASAFTGVEFTIGGSLSGCSLSFAAADSAHQDVASGAPSAQGPAGAYPPRAWIADDMDSAEAQTLRVPFRNQSGGNPSSALDPSELLFTLWQLDVPEGAADERCVADLRIDDVRFYRAEN